MQYYSTNKQAPDVTLEEAVVKGLAADKGLFMPFTIKPLPQEFYDSIDTLGFQEIAYRVADAFFGEDVPADTLKQIVYDTLNFDVPLVKVTENIYSLELFHGPTLAVKDVGDPSNFARVLDLYGGSHAAISAEISGAAYTDEQIAETVKNVWTDEHYLLDPHGACGFRALQEGLQPGETGVFLETAHPAKFKDTVENIIGEAIQIPEKLQAFMRGEKKSLPMSKDFADFKRYLMNV